MSCIVKHFWTWYSLWKECYINIVYNNNNNVYVYAHRRNYLREEIFPNNKSESSDNPPSCSKQFFRFPGLQRDIWQLLPTLKQSDFNEIIKHKKTTFSQFYTFLL